MLNKIRTNVVHIAWQANPKLPKPVQDVVEDQVHKLINLYSACMERGRSEAFWEMINTFCAREVIDIADAIRPMFEDMQAKHKPCDDWVRGLRNPAGGCTNCGVKH